MSIVAVERLKRLELRLGRRLSHPLDGLIMMTIIRMMMTMMMMTMNMMIMMMVTMNMMTN